MNDSEFSDQEVQDIRELSHHVIGEWDYPQNDMYKERVEKAEKMIEKCNSILEEDSNE